MLTRLQPGDPRTIGPYQLVGQLGGGGMGRVFLGRSAGGRLVAVKVIRSDLAADPDFRVRFRREVAAARRVSGVYTATVVDADADSEEPWLATAYVAGPSLAEAVHDHGPLPPTSALALAAGLAESLAAIHKAGVVHRDLKPSNVLLAEDGPRLIDFGISRAAESTSVTRAGFVIGSPGFMSPEQAQGEDVGPPSDIFSLGAVLVFAATGEPPFGSGTTAALVFRVVFAPANLDAVPEGIRPVVERCLAKDPSQRPSASELLTEIGAMQPVAGWLPDPVTSAFPAGKAPLVPEPLTPPTPPPAVKAEEPSAVLPATSPTVTGFTPFIAAEPELVTPAAATTPQPAETVADEDKAVTAEPATVPQGSGAGAPEAETVVPEPDAGLTRLRPAAAVPGAGPGSEPATTPDQVRGPEPGAVVTPLPGGDLPGPRRSRSRRPLILGAAAVVILIAAAGGTAVALSGSGHPSAAKITKPTVSVVATSTASTPSTQSGSALPALNPSPTGHKTSAPAPRHTHTQPAAVPTTPAPAPATSSAAPAPKPKPTPKPTHAPPPATYSFSASGASEESCAGVDSLQSSTGASVDFDFVNKSSGTVLIDEVSSSGGLINDATLSPGLSYLANSYVGLYYVVENSGGGCLAVFKVTGGGQVTIT
jgi:eukaryotic-like serine/threonine-protein kinase